MITGDEPITPAAVDTSYTVPKIYNAGLTNEFTGKQLIRGEILHYPGLTIRQHFASMAMQGYLASYDTITDPNPERLAKQSVKYADALITELNKDSDDK